MKILAFALILVFGGFVTVAKGLALVVKPTALLSRNLTAAA